MEGILPMLIYMSHWFQLSTYSTWYCSRDHWKYHCYCSSLHSLQQSCTTVTLLLQHPGILKQQHKGNIWWCPEWHVTSESHCWSACCSCSIQIIYLGNFRVFFFFFSFLPILWIPKPFLLYSQISSTLKSDWQAELCDLSIDPYSIVRLLQGIISYWWTVPERTCAFVAILLAHISQSFPGPSFYFATSPGNKRSSSPF